MPLAKQLGATQQLVERTQQKFEETLMALATYDEVMKETADEWADARLGLASRVDEVLA